MEEITPLFTLAGSLLPAVCGLCYGLILMFNRDSRSKRILGIILFISGLCWGNSMVMDNLYQVDGRAPVFNTWHILSNLMLWPVVRWYLILLFRPDSRFFPNYLKNFIPFFAALACVFIIKVIYGHVPDVYSMREFFSMLWDYPEFMLRVVMLIAFLVQTTVFFIQSNRDLNEYQRRVRNDFSELEGVDLRWVRWIIFLCFFAAALNLALAFSGDIDTRMWLSIGAFIYLGIIAILGGTQKDVFYLPDPGTSQDSQLLRPGKTALYIPAAMEVPGINPQTYMKVRDGLVKLMDEEEVFTRQGLRLDDLSAMLNTNKTYVSAVINDHYRTNFYTLVNLRRLEKAKELLREQRQIKEVWILAGFNSQKSFNTVFRKFTGTTPSEWAADS